MHCRRSRSLTLPTVADCRLMAAGVDWDAVRVPRTIGMVVLTILGTRSGAVIEDPCGSALYWFISKGAATAWDVPGTRPLGVTHHLVVPSAHRVRKPGPHWVIRPTDGQLTTDVRDLRSAVEDASTLRRTP
ncbi:hypothetical protein ACFOSC_30860 [Streptantibioticus rubrisoli]|uniref:Uncharacterized protein n=1 Tax=Streptantibioticus rubrisoli TaxID=1387313 RepID=A0ABT1PIV1_9ACTN|nr:hypothetical protein [Streptantibioticus rubrisoli]MCQ4045290.1 hypothetical protein [Streptantibioticus rubrisoli]